MRKEMLETVDIPEGVSIDIKGTSVSCKKSGAELSRNFVIPSITIGLDGNKIVIRAKKGNKNDWKKIKSTVAHIKNLINGVDKKFIYHLEACNVHFPMTLKLDKSSLVINNFLGEKVPRSAKILPNVDIDIKGTKITLSSHDKGAAGQTAANIEKATKIRYRDRRIFQDGIFITSKPEATK
jgi:large subunit ribosomal protein L6